MRQIATRLTTICYLLAAFSIAAGADQQHSTSNKSVQVDAAQKNVRMEFLLDKAVAAKVISLLEPQFKNVKFAIHPIFNGFYASGSERDLLDVKSLVPSLDKASEARSKSEREFIRVNYGDIDEIKKLLASLVPNVQFTVDHEHKLLILDGPRDAIEEVKEMLADGPGTEVSMDCQVFSLSPKGGQELCPSWFGPKGVLHRSKSSTLTQSLITDKRSSRVEQNQSTVEAPPASQDLGPEIRYFIGSESAIGDTLQSLHGSNEATMFARARVGVIAEKPTLVHLGDKFPIIYFDPRAGQFQVQFLELGLRLDVKATLMQGDTFEVEVTPEFHTLLDLKNNQYPQTTVRRFNRPILLKEGETIVIGGLMSEKERLAGSKIPLLNDLPILGRLFRFASEHNGEEILIRLTPHVTRY